MLELDAKYIDKHKQHKQVQQQSMVFEKKYGGARQR